MLPELFARRAHGRQAPWACAAARARRGDCTVGDHTLVSGLCAGRIPLTTGSPSSASRRRPRPPECFPIENRYGVAFYCRTRGSLLYYGNPGILAHTVTLIVMRHGPWVCRT